jgi:N-acyl-phosphatidylethanolamine-hydrolysing phospholipase D
MRSLAFDPASLYAPHHRAGRFFCPWAPPPAPVADVVRWKLSGNRHAAAKRRPMGAPLVANPGASLVRSEPDGALTWVGHSTFVIQEGDEVILTDPHWGPRALLPRRLVPPGVPLSSIPGHAFALLSHNHYDHLDAYTLRRLPPSVDWYVPLGLGEWLRQRTPARVVELDWWQSVRRGRFTLTCLPAQHWSNRLGVARNASLWCGWLIDSGERRYYFAGDTAYFHGFAEFGRRFPGIDVALLPIGAYEPRWFMRAQHINPAEAWRAFRELGAATLVGMHWGGFDLTDEPADAAPRVLAKLVRRHAGAAALRRLRLLAVGERWIPSPREN